MNTETADSYMNNCGHVYHSACILPWWDRGNHTCPECRKPCSMDTISKIYFNVESDDAGNDQAAANIADTDVKTLAFMRQIKEHIDVQTYNQTKDINDKFRQQQTEFSSLLLNGNQRLATNYNEKLSNMTKELTEVISDEHKRLLVELHPEVKPYIMAGSSSEQPILHDLNDSQPGRSFAYTALEYGRTRKAREIIPAIIALFCLIAVIVYSQLILNAVKSNELSGGSTVSNVSRTLSILTEGVKRINLDLDNETNKLNRKLDELTNLARNTNSADTIARLNTVTKQMDQMMLELVEGNRRGDMKLELLQNAVKMLQLQLDTETEYMRATLSKDQGALNQTVGTNVQLKAQLQRLQTIIANSETVNQQIIENNRKLNARIDNMKNAIAASSNMTAAELRTRIEVADQMGSAEEKSEGWGEKVERVIMSIVSSPSGSSKPSISLSNIFAFLAVLVAFQVFYK